MYPYLGWILLAMGLCSVAIWRVTPSEQRRLRIVGVFVAIALLLWGAAAYVPWLSISPAASNLSEFARAFAEIAGVQIFITFVFQIVLIRLNLPRFIAETATVLAYAAVFVSLLSRVGVNVAGLVATSAVATAVIGLALQDMLGNLVGGLVLQLEGGIEIGDWIKTDHGAGFVQHVRLRYTAITTADNDTVFLPNSFLTRTPVTLISRSHRKLIPFVLGYRRDLTEVMAAVEEALAASPLDGVAADPKPQCEVLDFHPGYIQFGIFVWLTRPGQEYAAISAVLMRTYAALARIGAPLRSIEQIVDLHTERAALTEFDADALSNMAAVRSLPIFRSLTDEERQALAMRLKHVTFAAGEVILRQGEEGDSMYIVMHGQVKVVLSAERGVAEPVAVLNVGEFFGEMSLLTGEKRTATVVAVDQVELLRLDKADLHLLLEQRPELAEDMSAVLAERQASLTIVRDKLDRETGRAREVETRTRLLGRIQQFFGLGAPGVAKTG